LAQVEASRRCSKGAGFGDRDEGFQRAQGHAGERSTSSGILQPVFEFLRFP
jgi:hypothetical protein